MHRRSALYTLSGLAVMSAVPVQATTVQSARPDDAAAVRALLDQHAAGWAVGDVDAMFAMATDDVHWINIVGMHWQGKAEVIQAYRFFLATMLKGVPLTLEAVESVTPVGDDVLVVVSRWLVGAFSPPDGSRIPAASDRLTMVLRRTPEGLKLAHGANVQIDAAAAPFDPVRNPPPGSSPA
ncbi:SgcJ/EcaC family oxidoreductase [Brevundimonas sp.]|uniref:SgcJ/EcaC family oxidoreductase n=1 Tax=Brevundimonas sp. TaxID=1871086 RepID=UPI0035612A8B